MSTGAPLPPRGRRRRVGRIALHVVGWTLAALLVLAGLAAWYASTPAFQNRIRRIVVARLESATGGAVQLKRFRWRLTHLEFEVDGLTIHGLEGPDTAPYAHVDRLFVRLQILSFFRPKIGLNYLEADHPVFHLIVYPDGTTNQPHPRHPSTGNAKDEIFNLEISRTVLNNGVAIFNEEKVPFDLAANHLAARISFVPARDHYIGRIHAEDIIAQRGAQAPIHSTLDASLDVGRNTAHVISLTLQSGPQRSEQKTVLRLAGTLENFASPHFQFAMKGAIDAREIRALTGQSSLQSGIVELDFSGQGTRSQYAINGTARISGGAYRAGTVQVSGLTADAATQITQDLIAVRHIHARLGPGSVAGDLRIVNWRAPAPRNGQPPLASREQGMLRAQLSGFTIDSVLDAVAPPRFRRLGFDGTASGTASVDWTGSIANLTGAADVTLAPSHPPRPGEVPVSGIVRAEYVHPSGTVNIHAFRIHTPGSEIEITGALGAYPVTRPSQLNVSLVTHNLSEFNEALGAFGISAPGQPSPVPAQLNGEAQFHGTVTGSLDDPDFRGHLQATDFNISPRLSNPTAQQTLSRLHFDNLTADAGYSAGSLSITAATLVQGKTTLQISGEVRGNRESPKDLFSASSAVRASVRVDHAEVGQWLALTGKNYPVSGSLNLDVHVTGKIGDPDGGGHLSLTGGAVDGETYRSLTADLQIRDKDVSARHLVFALDGGRITGDGGYNFAAKSVHFDIRGSGFQLAHIRRIQNRQYPVSGSVVFQARGSGTLQSPSLQASMHLRDLRLARESTGSIDADAETRGHSLQLHLAAHLNTATLNLSSQTQLGGDYLTEATLHIDRFDIDPLLRTFSVSGIRGSSSIAGVVQVSGPLKEPRQLGGDLRLSELSLTLEGVPIHSEGPLHATLRNGVLRMDPLHIVGTDTDLSTQGSVAVFEHPRRIHGSAEGAINIALAQTLDTDLISSGHVHFTLKAEGTTANPDLTGQVKFTDVNVALEDYTNGLSRMNGTLAFDQNRLDFKDVTAYSGGGLIKVGGFVTYQHGLYADLTASADNVRIRYPQGVTSTASARLRFQGSQANMLLSGHVTLTGFSVSPELNVASLQTAASGVSLPPNPNSPSNRVRLDIHITSAPSLNFQNSYARLAGNVNLVIRGTLAQPTVLGRITITQGSATFNGEKFELQHGEIYFSNPVRIQPNIDITATTTVEDYDITIGLEGTPSRLNPTFRSEPPLSEQDIFSLLAMGRTQEEQQIYSNEAQQAGVNTAADTLLGGAINATLSNRIQKLFGGGSVRIDPTFVSGVGNATARITIQEPISKKATLTYATNVNSTAEQLIQGEWHLTQNFSILAVRDESGVFSLIFRLHRRYH